MQNKRSRQSAEDTASKTTLFIAACVVAIGGIIYELLIATAASYMLGDTVLRFSLTIGLFLFGMGIGAWITGRLSHPPQKLFVINELALSFIGGHSITLLSLAFAYRLNVQFLFVALNLVVGALVGAEVPLLVGAIQGVKGHSKRVLSNVLSLDYIGSLIASIAFPLLLLPQLGLVRTAYLASLLNLVMVGLIIYVRRHHTASKPLLIAMVLIGSTLVAGYAYESRLQSLLNRSIYSDPVVYYDQSSYQKIVLTQHRDDIRLYLNDHLQFSSIDEARYHESLIHPLLSNLASRARVLVLGGGDGLAVREILKYNDVQHIQLVDLDPAMTQLARSDSRLTELNGDSLNDARVTVVHGDAFTYVQGLREQYDAVVVDLPDPNSSSLAKLYSDTFYLALKARLNDGGGIVVQASSPYFARKSFWTIEHTIANSGFETQPLHVYVPTFGEWGFIIGMTSPGPLTSIEPSVATRFVSDEQLAAMQNFPKDQLLRADESVSVSTLLRPMVHSQYAKDYAQWSAD